MTFTFRELDLFQQVTAIATFGLVLAAWCFGVLLWLRRHGAVRAKLRARLDDAKAASGPRTLSLWHEGEVATTTVQGDFQAPSFAERVRQLCRDAGWDVPLGALFATGALVVLVVGLGAFLATQRVIPSAMIAFTVGVVMWWYLNHRASGRKVVFERQLVDGLELSARALRAGHPLLASFRLIGDEIPAPVGAIFSEICQQQDMGVKLEDSLRRAALVEDNADMKLFAATLAINLRSGGNLAAVIEGLAHVIRDRMRLSRRFRTLIAQTQFSKRILIGMPIVMFGVLNLLNAEYVAPLYTTARGNLLLAVAAAGLFSGWYAMNKMATLTD